MLSRLYELFHVIVGFLFLSPSQKKKKAIAISYLYRGAYRELRGKTMINPENFKKNVWGLQRYLEDPSGMGRCAYRWRMEPLTRKKGGEGGGGRQKLRILYLPNAVAVSRRDRGKEEMVKRELGGRSGDVL